MRIPCISILFVLAISPSVNAYNHPEIRWRSVTTDHFIINYYDKTEPALYPTWKIAEQAYSTLSEVYHFTPAQKIQISLADYDDYSNGYADWTSGAVMIYLPEMRSDLRSSTVWLHNVVIHELTHIMSLEKRREFQLIDLSPTVGYATPSGSVQWTEPFAGMSFVPSWSSEGAAQLESANQGGDCWDSRREMLLRCGVRDKNLLSIDEMGYFNHTSLGNEKVYNQGFAFSKFLFSNLGPQRYRAILEACARSNESFENAFRYYAQGSLPHYYALWVDSLTRVYSRQTFHYDPQVLWKNGAYNQCPHVSHDGKYWGFLTSDGDDGDRTDLIVAHWKSGKIVCRIPYAQTSWCFGASGNDVFFIRSREPDNHGSFLNDIYRYDIANNRFSRLTHGARVYDLSASPDGKSLTAVRYESGKYPLDNFSLAQRSFSRINPGSQGEPFLTTCWSPDGARMVISRLVDGKSRLFLYSPGSDSLRRIETGGDAQEESPFWAADGKIYYSADYDGIFNLYSVAPDSASPARLSDAPGGLFSPGITPDGSLICSAYNSAGFSIVKIVPTPDTFTMPQRPCCTFNELPKPRGTVVVNSTPYQTSMLRSAWDFLIAGDIRNNKNLLIVDTTRSPDSIGYNFSFSFAREHSDALDKVTRILGIGAGFMSGNYGNLLSTGRIGAADQDSSSEIHRDLERLAAITTPADKKLSRASFSSPPSLFLDRNTQTRLIANASSGSESQDPDVALLGDVGFGWMNATLAPTLVTQFDIGFASNSSSGDLMILPLPQVANLSVTGEWQVSREVFLGMVPGGELIFPYLLDENDNNLEDRGFLLMLPLYLRWVHDNYENKDIQYNQCGVTQLSIMAGPIRTIALSLTSYYFGDTTLVIDKGLTGGLSLQHGFPLTRCASLLLSTNTSVTAGDEQVLDPLQLLKGLARTYLTTEEGVSFIFPIVRSIDQGALYLDGLYGNIGYSLYMHSNDWAFQRINTYTAGALTDPQYDPSALAVGHFVSAGFELGNYKSYVFFRMLRGQVSYELLRKSMYFSMSMGF